MNLRRILFLSSLLCCLAPRAPAAAGAVASDWTVQAEPSGAGGVGGREFRESARGVSIEGEASFVADGEELRLHGVYRTTQAIDVRSRLSYQLHAADGRLVKSEGQRFAWRAAPGGGLEAEFEIVQSVADQKGLRTAMQVRFNYVVEGEYWQSDRRPEMFLPRVGVRAPVRAAFFRVGAALVPPVLPAGTRCWLPAWVTAEFGGAPAPFQAALDFHAADGGARLEQERSPLPKPGGGSAVVFYHFLVPDAQQVLVRPSFVWDGVKWFDGFDGNGFRTVRVVGPLAYLVGLTLAAGAVGAAAGGVRRLKNRWLRWVGGLAVVAAGAAVLAGAAVSVYALVVLGLMALHAAQRRLTQPGPQAYWTLWGFLLLLDLYWRHCAGPADQGWVGTLFSAALAGLFLLPLRWLRWRRAAAIVATGLVLVALVVATALVVYAGFFGDYPSLSDLLYAEQLGAVGDSIWVILGERQWAAVWLGLCCCGGLWWTVGAGAARDRRNVTEDCRPGADVSVPVTIR